MISLAPYEGPTDPRAFDLIGQRYGKLVVTKFQGRKRFLDGNGHKKTKNEWLCRCDCGQERVYCTGTLTHANITHCGCSPALAKKDGALSRRYSRYRGQARPKGREFSLSKEEFEKLVKGDCVYCGQPPASVEKYSSIPDSFNGIDRVDNERGYVLDNCVTACPACNVAKGTMSVADFKSWIQRAYEKISTEGVGQCQSIN